MSKSNFTVKCPYCGKDNDFTDDNWHDDLVDCSGTSDIDCMHCDYPMTIITHAVYTLEVEPYDEEASKEHVDPYESY